MLVIDSSGLLRSIQEAKKVIQRKMEHMVKMFAYQATSYAINNTPIGDSSRFAQMYINRQQYLGLEPVEGFARGSWQAVVGSSPLIMKENYGRNSGEDALSQTLLALSGYKLGQPIVIGNKGPYIAALENNYSNQTLGLGIIQPTVDQIVNTYAVNLQQHYEAG